MARSAVRALFLTAVVAVTATTVLAPVSLAETGDDSSVTVAAPGAGSAASVTVDHTADLVNQTVHVSWTGFRPSSGRVNVPGNTMYVVRVYQCRGEAPASPADCYGSKSYTYDGQSDSTAVLPDGPGNARDAATAPDGTGSVDIEIRTTMESSTLGCRADAACSVVVVPNYGNGRRNSDFVFATSNYMDSTWSWDRHVTVPLHFATAGATCPLGVPGVTTVGAPALQRAVQSWRPAACEADHPVNADYTALGEPLARDRYVGGNADLALTTLPTETTRPTVYAPLAVSGISIAFHVDDGDTGLPITDMKLDARLVAKLITESYGGVGYVAPGQPLDGKNPATQGNPYSIYTDPEFLALNPGHVWPRFNPTNPLLLAGNSDLTWELTRWIQDDPDARAWLDGADDGHGMHVNTHYKGIEYPATALETKDPYPALSYTFVPINGLDHVARALVADQPSSSNPTEDPITHQHAKDPQQLPGQRALIAIIDTADAAAFNAPQAAVRNAGGAFVTPTTASLTAAVEHMIVDPKTATRRADHASTDTAAYPLTVVHYAMAPTGDLAADKADQVARLLDYAAGPGQQAGRLTGELPGGYVPLTEQLRQQLTAASAAVRSQSGKPAPAVTTRNGDPAQEVSPPSGYTGGQVGGPADAGADGGAPLEAPAADPVVAPGAARPAAAAASTPARAVAVRANVTADRITVRYWWRWAFVALLVAGTLGPALMGLGVRLAPSRSPGRRRSS